MAKYEHPGDAWTDVVTRDTRLVMCDRCAESERAELNLRCEIELDDAEEHGGSMARLARIFSPFATWVGYFNPEGDDRCDKCGVVAAEQHKEEDT